LITREQASSRNTYSNHLATSYLAPIIVAVDQEYVAIEEVGSGLYSIEVSEDERDFETKLQELWGAFTTRLQDEELESANIVFLKEGDSARAEETAYDADGENDVEDGDDAGYLDQPEPLTTGEGADANGGAEDEDADEEEEEATFPTSYLVVLC